VIKKLQTRVLHRSSSLEISISLSWLLAWMGDRLAACASVLQALLISNGVRFMRASRKQLLLIEDDPQIVNFLTTVLEAYGYLVRVATTGRQGLAFAAEKYPDVVVLDLGLPDISGLDVITEMREKTSTPILVLSARSRETDKVKALDLGADDYVVKPFVIGELLARLRVAVRSRQLPSSTAPTIIRCGDLIVEVDTRRVTVEGAEVNLTKTEYQILTILVENRGKVITYRQLVHRVWGGFSDEGPQNVRMCVSRLRKKIEKNSGNPRYLVTEVGVGYRFADDDPSSERMPMNFQS
jgi:two-component system KDP operon response regulator KdpE